MKKTITQQSILIIMTFMLAIFGFNSCGDDLTESYPAGEAPAVTVTVSAYSQTVEAVFMPNGYAVSYRYGIGLASDLNSFRNGTLEDIVNVNPAESRTVRFEGLTAETPYVIFVEAVHANGVKGDLETIDAATTVAVEAKVQIVISGATFSRITAAFTTQDAVTLKFAVGTLADEEKFADGTLTGIIEVPVEDTYTYTFMDLTPETEYTVFAQGVNEEGMGGEIAKKTATTIEMPLVGIHIEQLNTMFCEVTSTPDLDRVSRYLIASAGEEVYWEFVDIFDGDEEMLLSMVGYEYTEEVTEIYGLSGVPEFAQMIVIAAYDENDELIDILYEKFSTPEVDPSLSLPEAVTIKITDITSTTARIVYTMNANTVGYYQLIIQKDSYDTIANNPDFTEDKKFQEFRFLLLMYGYMMTENDDYLWEDFDPATEFVALGLPFNENGEDGWGSITAEPFTTLGTRSVYIPVSNFLATKRNYEVIPMITKDQVLSKIRQ